MANWCSNNVIFTGDRISEVIQLFEKMREKEYEMNEGQKPDFITVEDLDRYMFDIRVEDESINYETKWAPNGKDLIRIADEFGLEFEHEYSELGMLIFGKGTYKNGVHKEIDLDNTDFEQYEYDEDKDRYIFRGEEWESDYEILETLLNEKENHE